MATTMQPNLRFLRVSTLLLFILSSRETEARAASSLVSAAAAATTPEATTIKSNNNIVSPSRDTLSSSTPPSPSSSPANLDQPFEPSFNLQDVMKSRRTVSRKEQLVQQFLIDMKKIQSLPVTKLTTPCHLVCKDTSNTKTWNLEDWDRRECIFFRSPFLSVIPPVSPMITSHRFRTKWETMAKHETKKMKQLNILQTAPPPSNDTRDTSSPGPNPPPPAPSFPRSPSSPPGPSSSSSGRTLPIPIRSYRIGYRKLPFPPAS
mmetsp:Transcript_13287/g.25942  ORF Transcript_13287/g.25942 Transcript_13287/m.25942 type:complete len:262 (-) Transcript_13287:932-1717(-)